MQYGHRYDITLLDVAILRDCDVPLKPLAAPPTAKVDNPVRAAPKPMTGR
jgi:hypothetical protein